MLDQAARKTMTSDWSLLAGVRFALAGIVACTHIGSWFTDHNAVTLVIADMGAKAAVTGFFLLSGYSIAASMQRNTEGYYRRRFIRIYPIYLLAIVTTFILDYALRAALIVPRGAILPQSGYMTYVGNLLFMQTFLVKPIALDSPIWSLAVEVAYYLVAPLFLRLPKWTVLAVIGASAISFALPRNDSYGMLYFVLTRLNVLVFAWPWFMGFYLFYNRRAAVVASFAVLGAALIYFNTYLNPERYAVQTYLVSLAILVVAANTRMFTQRWPKLRAWLNLMGDVSYPLYVLQCPIMLAAFAFWNIQNAQILLALCIIGSVAAYYAVDVYAKRRMVLLFSKNPLARPTQLRARAWMLLGTVGTHWPGKPRVPGSSTATGFAKHLRHRFGRHV